MRKNPKERKRGEKTTTLDSANPKHRKNIESYFGKFDKRLSEDLYIESQLGVWRLHGKFTNEENPSEPEIKEFHEFMESTSLVAYGNLTDELDPLASKIKSIHDAIIIDPILDETDKINKSLRLAAESAIIQTKNAVKNREVTQARISISPSANPKKPVLISSKTKTEGKSDNQL